jgi:hypothetical protein
MRERDNIFPQTVTEGDIDWILCIELNSSESFRTWFSSLVSPDLKNSEHVGSWRSISNHLGESDLICLVEKLDGRKHMILVENKINAAAQEDQYLRYVQRGEGYINDGLADSFSVVLLSPEAYRSKDSSDYPINIPYELIVEWLSSKTDARSKYLTSIYEAAINKRLSSSPIDLEMSMFREQVWDLATKEFSELNVPKPISPAGSEYWIFMKQDGYTLIHKTFIKGGQFTRSVVDLELSGRGDDVENLQEKYNDFLIVEKANVVKTGKSASFRLEAPLIAPPLFEEEKIRKALKHALLLKTWWDTQTVE